MPARVTVSLPSVMRALNVIRTDARSRATRLPGFGEYDLIPACAEPLAGRASPMQAAATTAATRWVRWHALSSCVRRGQVVLASAARGEQAADAGEQAEAADDERDDGEPVGPSSSVGGARRRAAPLRLVPAGAPWPPPSAAAVSVTVGAGSSASSGPIQRTTSPPW